MRLAEVLSKPQTPVFQQVEGFLDERRIGIGKQRKIKVGNIALNYFCGVCEDVRTFYSGEEIYCIGVNEHLISIDCVLTCRCGSSVQLWFLVDCDGEISERAPEVRILKRNEKLSHGVLLNVEKHGAFSEFLEKAHHAHREGLGAGSMVYLRKIFEQVTQQTAIATGIEHCYDNGRRKPFRVLLEEVDRQCSIIPREFSANGYRLFGELSDIVHGEYDEEVALQKYKSLNRLVIGILDNIKNNTELMNAVGSLGWINSEDDINE